MSSETGKNIKLTIFGESHGAGIGMVLDNIPAGEEINMDELYRFMLRRQGGNNPYSTPRKEADKPEFLSGVLEGKTTGSPICAVIRNENTRSGDYKLDIPRPGHADFTAYVKHGGANDARGGGHFSGRLTAPLCIAGGILKQILKRKGIQIHAHISSIGGINDIPLNNMKPDENQLNILKNTDFPVLDTEAGKQMKAKILDVRSQANSVGGSVECVIYGVGAGYGDPIFDGIENRIASAIFGLGAVKGIEFGSGFDSAKMTGTESNDEFYIENGEIKTYTNNHGGILGGITSGMPIVFNTAFKPTPSIGVEQRSVSFSEKNNVTFKTHGRHDPCIVPRAVPCVEAVAALVIADFIL